MAQLPPLARTTLASCVRAIGRTLELDYGLDPAALLRDCGIDPQILHDCERRLELANITRLWAHCVARTGDPGFGLRAARHTQPADLYGIDLALYASATLGQAVQRYARFTPLLTTVTRAQLFVDADGDWRLEWRLTGSAQPYDAARDYFNYFNVRLFERQSGGTARDILRRIELVVPATGHKSWEALEVPLLYEQPCAALVFRKEAWDMPLPGANALLLTRVEQPILHYLSRLGAPLPLSALRARLVDLLPNSPSLPRLAEALQLPLERLQHSLNDQQTSFAQLLDQTRQAQAQQMLALPSLSIDQVATRVGFSSSSALIRAFRRWTGTTPLNYRKRLHSRPPDSSSA